MQFFHSLFNTFYQLHVWKFATFCSGQVKQNAENTDACRGARRHLCTARFCHPDRQSKPLHCRWSYTTRGPSATTEPDLWTSHINQCTVTCSPITSNKSCLLCGDVLNRGYGRLTLMAITRRQFYIRYDKRCHFNVRSKAGMPSVLWHCWLGGRKGIQPVKNWVVRCWHGHLSGARCRLAYGPADSTATHCLLLQ